MVDKLVTHGARVDVAGSNPFIGQASNWTPLHVLAHAAHDHTELARLLKNQRALVDGLQEHLVTTESPLMLAIYNDCFVLAEELVGLDADPNYTILEYSLLRLARPTTVLGHVVTVNA